MLALEAAILGKVSLKGVSLPLDAATLGIYCFGKVLEHFGPKAAQMLQMVSFGTIFDDFRPKAPQILQMVSFGTSLVHFKPKTAQKFQMVSLVSFWTISSLKAIQMLQ